MHYFDYTTSDAETNLAIDEALLDAAEENGGPEILRFWEPSYPFVVLGVSKKYQEEVFVDACEKENISILRRCSGGGTVIQAPGCLNYSVILKIQPTSSFQSLSETTHFVLNLNRKALATVTDKSIDIQGISDLASDGLKFSGNAQRRKKNFSLVHGTFLYNINAFQIQKFLREPKDQPEYRAKRPHEQFVKNIDLSPEAIKTALTKEWNAQTAPVTLNQSHIQTLIKEKYGNKDWNRRF